MARYRGAKGKICRRFGENLYGNDKYAQLLSKKGYPAGEHGKKFSRNVSEYGKQLLMKQKAKFTYGIMEKQFRKHYEDVKNRDGVTGDLLLARLEMRLDNVVYRMGLAETRPQARQIVSHNMVFVNGKRLDVPSYEVKIGDTITLNPKKAENGYWKSIEEFMKNYKSTPSWISFDGKSKEGKVTGMPKREDFDANIDAAIIVEFYSK